MDPLVLTDPAFWTAPEPFAAGDFPGGIPDRPELRNHVLFETSGSSGKPKWIALSKAALLVSAAAVNRHLDVSEASCWGLALPASHVGGFGVIARAFEAACGLRVFHGKWNPERFAEWASENGITHTSLVPTQVYDLVAGSVRAPETLVAVVVGGGSLDNETGRTARDLGWPVLASYGMTEAASQIATQTLDSISFPYQSSPIPLLPIWDAGITEEGLFHISGPALFTGILVGNDFIPRSGKCHITMDRVAFEEGGITPLGRADTRVKVLGELVDPEAIERRLVELSRGRLGPGTFAIAALPDPRAGHRLVAVAGANADAGAFEAACGEYNKQSVGFQRIERMEGCVDLPAGPLGKIRRAELAALLGFRK